MHRTRTRTRTRTRARDELSHPRLPHSALSHSTLSHRALAHRGFSLIELLVVLVILGVVIAAVVLSIGGGAARELEAQARRVEALIALACEQSELTGRDLGLFVSERELSFAWRGPDRWYPLADQSREPLRPRAIDAGVEITLARDGETLILGADAPVDPQLACLSSGELSPFELRFSRADVEQRWRLTGQVDGSLMLEAEDAR